MALMPDGSYDLKAFATDDDRDSVVAYAVFSGTHTGEGGPVRPDWQAREQRLRLRHEVRRGQDRPHDQDLALGNRHAAARLGLSRAGGDAVERSFLLRHLEIVTALALRLPAVPDAALSAPETRAASDRV